MNGIVIVDKPQDWTSQDVTARLRRVFNTRRIGHGGTLDPMATGVLPVFVGRATRGVEFFEHAEKIYETTLRLGLSTDTEDITGTVLEERKVELSEQDFLGILPKFRGKIQQIPPMSSACLLPVENFQPKNKFNQRSEKMWKQKKTVKGDQIIISLVISKVKDL